MQHVGETRQHLSEIFGECRRAIETAINHRHINQPTADSDHFTLPGHLIINIELIPLELINSHRCLKTLEPHGMNRRDEISEKVSPISFF